MRAYFFGNMYLSSIQQGIQAAHVVAEMFTKYTGEDSQHRRILEHWATDHKTMVLLNAGYSEEIWSLVSFFNTAHNPLPWAHFKEGKDALDSAITSIGIILPEEFYEAAKELRTITSNAPTPFYNKLETEWERQMAARLNNYGLAR